MIMEYAELRSAAEPYLAGLPELPDFDELRAYAAGEHPHVPAGSSSGGQFAPKKKGSDSGKKPPPHSSHSAHSSGHSAHAGQHAANDTGDLAYNGKTGAGYGMPGGSKKVKGLQDALVRLGLASKGDKALSDGKYGPKTAAAVKQAQKALGLKQDGIATPALIAQLAKLQHLPHHASSHAHRSAEIFSLPPLPPPADEQLRKLATIAEEGHKYWTKGEGLAKWAPTDHPWTSLYHHLIKFMNPDEAKRTATEWFHEVFGFYPGSDMNRVTHGKPPRGHRVGPG
jgi:hypothetical protein